jgi:hypothetical protein
MAMEKFFNYPAQVIDWNWDELPDLPSDDSGEGFIRFFFGDGLPLKKNLM